MYIHLVPRFFVHVFIALVMMPNTADAWWWALPAKVDGVFHLDRFGGCYLYNDIGLIYVTDKQKAVITPYVNKHVVVNVTDTYQLSFPGDIRIDQFNIESSVNDSNSHQDQIQLTASWLLGKKGKSLKVNVKNVEKRNLSFYPGIIDFFVLTRKYHPPNFPLLLDVSDGPSAILGRERVFGQPQRTWMGTYSNEQERLSWSVRDGKQTEDTIQLPPGKSIDIVIDLECSTGQYEIFFGYKALRDSSYETSMKINDLVLPVTSNSILINSNYLGQLPLVFWLFSVPLCALLGYCLIRLYVRRINLGSSGRGEESSSLLFEE